MQSVRKKAAKDSPPDAGGIKRRGLARWPLAAAGLIVLATWRPIAIASPAPLSSTTYPRLKQTSDPSALADLVAALPAKPRRDGQRPPAAEPFPGNRLRHKRFGCVELSRNQPCHSYLGGPGVVRHLAADFPAAFDARSLGAAALPLALAIAIIWAVHPLQTASVTYVIQRAESLFGLFYLLTLYCFVRGVDSPRAVLWYAGSVAACLLGMASKEVMVSAPLMVLFYDRAFVGGSFREALRRRYGLYLALAGTWLLLGFMVAWSGTRGNSSGFGIGVGCWEYLCTQFGAILNYLKLCVWPCPLVFDYGNYIAENVLEIAVCGVVVVLAGLATVVALWRWPKVGFLGVWFFAIFAPTTSFIPELQTVAEHRMYLPLAAVVTGLVVAGCLVGRRLVQRGEFPRSGRASWDVAWCCRRL